MVTVTAQVTSTTDTAPVVVKVEKELSGAQWCIRFPGSKTITTLEPRFQQGVSNFLLALQQAGAQYHLNATYRPPERAYLMTWCWMLANGQVEPKAVPPRNGVLIEWVHATKEKSIAAAKAMVREYRMTKLLTKPAGENSLHCVGEAIDVDINWEHLVSLKIKNAADKIVTITSNPRTGMNTELWQVGRTYRVIKFFGGAADKPHWSSTGK